MFIIKLFSILPFINPPFNPEKSSLLCDLIQIQTQEVKNTGEPVQDVFTATDLKDVLKIESKAKNNSESGWKLCTADINWSNVPLGTFFT